MSGTTQENDPSIEEILASIRQIISDDDEAAAAKEDVAEVEHDSEDDDDVLELTEKVKEPDPVIETKPEPELPPPPSAPKPEPEVKFEPSPVIEEDLEVDLSEHLNTPPQKQEVPTDTELLSERTATAAIQGFSKLARDIQVNRHSEGITLEDIVRAQLEPLLKEWLDKNLPPMIETLVEKELQKISKRVLGE